MYQLTFLLTRFQIADDVHFVRLKQSCLVYQNLCMLDYR